LIIAFSPPGNSVWKYWLLGFLFSRRRSLSDQVDLSSGIIALFLFLRASARGWGVDDEPRK
jgi:hypothetical protein